MHLSQGTKIGAFEILGLLGEGGMGHVYRARDMKLKREVAIKTLPEAFIRDADRLARLQREAELLASLNHPNIAAIHNLEESADGSRFLVLELVEGETLADRIAKGPIPVDEAVRMAKQIAEAIEAAHLKGIIHRDLKPANVKITPEGKIKVLDFGLAKIYEPETASPAMSHSPTLVSASMPGTIVGTAPYMSPEQARGQGADAQADIWAFGCLLFEMFTGRRAFPGETIADVFASIMKSQPDWEMLPADTPVALRLLLRRCLQKDRRRRIRNIGDAALELDETSAEPATSTVAPIKASRFVWVIALVSLALAVVAVVFVGRRVAPSSDVRTIRFGVPAPERFFKRGEPTEYALSPDGRHLVFAAEGTTRNLWIRSLDSAESRPIAGTETDNSMLPFWSPDSQYVGFYRSNKLYKLVVADGRTEIICDVGGFPDSTWGSNNTIVYAADGKLYRVSSNGARPELLSIGTLQNENIGRPHFLPDGDHLLFDTNGQGGASWILSLKSGELKKVLSFAGAPLYSPTGHLLYLRDRKLFAQSFDTAKLELSGDAILITKEAGPETGVSSFDLSSTGILAWSGPAARAAQVVWRDRTGKVIQVALKSGLFRQIRLSPDSSRAAVVTVNNGKQSAWLLEMSNGVFSRLTSKTLNDNDLVWSPDGRHIALSSGGNLYRSAVDGAEVQPLLESKESKWVHDWSPDGRFLVYAYGKGVYALPLTDKPNPITLLENDFNKDEFRVSPDSRWIAYNATEGGRSEVYIASFPKFDRRRQVSNQGGAIPRWRSDMREMYYLRLDGTMMAVDVRPGETLETGAPHELFKVEVPVSTVLDQYDVTPDGKRFIVIENEENASSPPINVVVNWPAELPKK